LHIDGSSSIRQPGAAGGLIYHGAQARESERWEWQACAGRKRPRRLRAAVVAGGGLALTNGFDSPVVNGHKKAG